MFKGFKGQIEISNEDALRLASKINPLPNAPVISYASNQTKQVTNKKVTQKPKPQKKEEGMGLFGKIIVAAIGIYIASEIIDELSDDSSSSSSTNRNRNTSNPTSGLYPQSDFDVFAQDLLDRQAKISNQRVKTQRKNELVSTLVGAVSTRGGDTTTSYLTISDANTCSYGFGSSAFKIAKGLSPCPMNVQVPVGSGVFDANQMNYSSPYSLKTTWYLDSSSTSSCTYKYGASKRTIPKGTSSMCPLSTDF
jgi:hypothetical protein